MVAIFPKLCLWRRSLCSNLGGIGPEKLYRATLKERTLRYKMYFIENSGEYYLTQFLPPFKDDLQQCRKVRDSKVDEPTHLV